MPYADRQLPESGELFLDHIAHFVPDMAAAGAALEGLGYRLTPFTHQQNSLKPDEKPTPAGTANRLVMLRRGYLEFLTAVADTPLARQLQAAVQRYVGLHLLAFAVSDAETAWKRLEKQGFAPTPLVRLTRPVEMPDGRTQEARFSVVRVPPETMPEGRIQILTHYTEGAVWQERWMNHPNRIEELHDVLLAVKDPEEAATRFARFLDRKAERNRDGWHLETDRGTLTFVAPDALPAALPGCAAPCVPFMAGYSLVSADLPATAHHFQKGGGAVEEIGSGVLKLTLPAPLGGTQIVCARGQRAPWRG